MLYEMSEALNQGNKLVASWMLSFLLMNCVFTRIDQWLKEQSSSCGQFCSLTQNWLKMPIRDEQDKIQLWKETMFSIAEVQTLLYVPKIITFPISPMGLPLS